MGANTSQYEKLLVSSLTKFLKKPKPSYLIIAAIILIFIFLTSTGSSNVPEQEQEVTSIAPINEEDVLVARVIDGDTIELENGRKVRYIGIDTPEVGFKEGCFGKEAMGVNKSLVEGKSVRLEKDISETDKFGRLLRYVYLGGTFVNDYLVRQGYAVASTFPPDVKYQGQFIEAEREARDSSRGFWSECSN